MATEIPSGRRDSIAARLADGQRVSSGLLAAEFDVSEDAIRRDLRMLAAVGLCRRVYGGALPAGAGAVPIATRVTEALPQKRALADAAVSLIEPGSLLAIDNGSTNLMVANMLPQDLGLMVATSSVEIAFALAARNDVRLILMGGEVDPMIGGCVDGTALEAVSRLNIDLCLLGACTIPGDDSVGAFDLADTTFKRALLARSQRSVALVTNDKLGRQAPHRIGPIKRLDHIVVEHDAPAEAVERLEGGGSSIIRAAPPASRAIF